MDEVYELGKLFPSGASVELLDDYVGHHLNSVANCVDNELYSSAYSHLHLLYMAFIYIQLLRIAKEKQQEFEYGWIGFPSEEKDFLNKPISPFSFSRVNERTVFRFFRLVGFADDDIANVASLISTRNDRLHAKGLLYCASEKEFEKELSLYISKMHYVIQKQSKFLKDLYVGLVSLYDVDYEFTGDDLESNFVDQYLFSEYELTLLADGNNDIVSKFVQENI